MADNPNSGDLLVVTDLSVRYGGVVALDSVSITVPRGKIVGLIGPNGAGKTTFVDALTGFTRSTGEIRFNGTRLHRQRPHARARLGLARTFQSGGIFDDLTVKENILIGERRDSSWTRAWWAILTGRPEKPRRETAELIAALNLEDVLGSQVSELSEGHRKLVSVAQALASQPVLVLLDEPAAGLDSAESAWLGEKLQTVRAGGVTILLVDHDMDLVMNVCDEIVVLDFGQVIAAGPPREVLADPKVISAYLGSVIPDLQELT
ncbi:MAG: branched-chain amino acid transporter ATPase/permease [Pseudonocardiales bacterium]|nr:branched-chain amino acid transporter ATPase/permease [Pseudonocardiales bacterium]